MQEDILFKNPIFATLSSRERSILSANCILLEFDEEELFIKSESMLFSVYFIASGMVKVRDSKKNLFWLSGESDFLGLISLYIKKPVFFSAYAVPQTKIFQIEANVFRKFMATNPQFLDKVFQQNGNDIHQFIQSNTVYKKNKIGGAMADFLLQYSEKGFLEHLTRKEIGEILGYSRENITKVMQTYIKEGYIKEEGKHITIVNKAILEQLRKFG